MLPLSTANEWISHIQEGIKPGDLLYGKKIFPSGRREDKKIILIENDDDDSYAFLIYKNNTSNKFSLEVALSPQDIMEVINYDHAQAMKTNADN